MPPVVRLLSSMESYELERYAQEVFKATGVGCAITRVSTAELVVLAADPHASRRFDLLFGTALSALLDPRVLAQLITLDPDLNMSELPVGAMDYERRWFAPSAYSLGFCVDLLRLDELRVDPPASWGALACSKYKGNLAAPDPRTSGAGYLQVCSILQAFGVQAGWRLLEDLHDNVSQYTASGCGPCEAVTSGRAAVGVSVAIAVSHLVSEGARVSLAFPQDALGCEPEGFGMFASAAEHPEALKVLRWTLTSPAQSLFASLAKIPLCAGGSGLAAGKLVCVDPAWAARERMAILARWSQMVGG